jgi:hypothetical protein
MPTAVLFKTVIKIRKGLEAQLKWYSTCLASVRP